MHKFSMKTAAVVAVLGGMIAGAVSASAALNLPTQSCSYMFNSNMRLGSRGTDVMNLQKVLNAYPQTQVSASGAGSPGMETSYFGAATRAAVNKFQALHLVELGITAPTGNVFAGTRGLLNQVCAGTAGNNGNTGGNTGGTVQSGPVSVMLSASQPSGMLVVSQAGALLANLTFTGNGTVTSVELQRIGVSTDSSLNNVYLYDGNVRISDAASVVTGGYIRFNASNGLFAVNGSRTVSVRADIASTAQNQSVGIKLNSVTAMGSAPSSYSNVMGNVLLVGSASPATANFSAVSSSTATVDAGTTNYNIWSGTVSIGTRDVNLKAATFKFVGSAPVDAAQNISLFVDGTKVAGPSMINSANNNKVSFDLGSMPFLLKTGSHTIDVRADIVKGSNRTITMSIENVADLMMEDTSLYGVNIAATVQPGTQAMTQSNTTYKTITVSKGSVTVEVDSSFNATKVTGGSTNVPIAQFTLKGYGEDVKVNTLQIAPALSSAAPYDGGLPNVSLYVNGGQVGTSQNYTGSALTYNLGSSLIVPAGQTVTLTVKADIVNATSSAVYTAGSLSVALGGVSSNAQGQSSNELVSVAGSAVTGNALTVSSGAGTFARTAGFTAATVSPNSSNVKIGSFTLQANSSEALKVSSIGVAPYLQVYGITNLSNLTLKTGSTVLGTPVGNPTTATTSFSFPTIVVPANGTMTFDVYANIGGASVGSTTAAMEITYRGAVSNTTTNSYAAGVAITSSAASLSTPTLVASSPTTQAVVGGSNFGIATFKLSTASAGTQATVREMRFSTVGTDAIESITVGGVTSPVVSGTSTVTGLNIVVGSTGTDVPVTVKYSGFLGSTNGGSLQTSVASTSISLSYVEATTGSGAVSSSTAITASRTMSLVASKPTVTVSAGNTVDLTLGVENKVGEFTVTADANGKVAVATATLTMTGTNISSIGFSGTRVADGNTTITSASVSGSSTPVITFTPAYEISAGQSKTFSIYSTVNGAQSGTNKMYVTSAFVTASSTSFKWLDVIGGNTVFDAGVLPNFPTNGYSTIRQ